MVLMKKYLNEAKNSQDKKDLVNCINFLSKMKNTFVMDDIHFLMNKYGKGLGLYTTIVDDMVKRGVLSEKGGKYKLTSKKF